MKRDDIEREVREELSKMWMVSLATDKPMTVDEQVVLRERLERLLGLSQHTTMYPLGMDVVVAPDQVERVRRAASQLGLRVTDAWKLDR